MPHIIFQFTPTVQSKFQNLRIIKLHKKIYPIPRCAQPKSVRDRLEDVGRLGEVLLDFTGPVAAVVRVVRLPGIRVLLQTEPPEQGTKLS